uniref:Major facilitator superfamily (MFS) profile domain-containing protein n=1 Tax=Ditylenchus dipsaci TaxID=166011 RepID=A0A915DV73_9BILA
MSAIGLYSCMDVSSMVISRLPCLLMHGQQAHQSLLANLTKPGKQRTKAFGRLGLTFGLGFVFTPLLSKLSSVMGFGERAPLLTAVAICLLALALLCFFIPDRNQAVKQEEEEEVIKGETSVASVPNINMSSLTGVLKRPNVLNLILQKNAAVAPALLIFSVLQLDLINRFSITSSGNSLLQIFIGVNIMMTNTVGISWMRSKFAEPVLVRLGLSAFIFTYVQFCWFHHLWQLAPMMMSMCFAMTLVGTVADSLLTSAVQFEQQGIVLGISTSMNSLVRTFSPALAGYLLQSYGIASIGFIGGLSTSAALLLHLLQPLVRISPASPPPTTNQEQGEHLLTFSQENKKGL